jgi:cytochrome c oxidase assembly protein subunit 15
VDSGEQMRQRMVSIWLFACAALVYTVLIVGGVTRLTHSGLSIAEWQPLVGALPPWSDHAWAALFERYRATPEYRLVTYGITLAEFKHIFWWEYAHRLLARLAGFAFLLPLLWFVWSGKLSGRLWRRLAILFVLGGLQGALGWSMVASGLVDSPRVSPILLAGHLALALLIIGAMLWTAWDLRVAPGRPRRVPLLAGVTVVGVYLMAIAGALVAGTKAGFAYNTFPLMDGALVPEGLLRLSPWYLNFVDNVTAVQFTHRAIGWTLIALVPTLWWWTRKSVPAPTARIESNWMLVALVLQVGLGISTLLSVVALPLAAAHQAGAVALFAATLWTTHALSSRIVTAGGRRDMAPAQAPEVPVSA